MTTEKQYIQQILQANVAATNNYLANGGVITLCKPGTPKQIRDLQRQYGFMGGKRRWDANISDRNRQSTGLSLNDLHAKMLRPDAFCR